MTLLESLIEENKRLSKANKLLSDKLSVAIEGLEVLFSAGNIAGIPQKTLDEIKSYNKDLPQDDNLNEQDI